MEHTPEQKQISKVSAGLIIILMIIGGIYKIGYEAGKAETAESMQKQINHWKKQSGKVTEKIVIKYVDRVKEITKWRTKNVEIIKIVPSACELSNGWVHVHDSSAKACDANATEAADATPSGIADTEALKTIVENYAICRENSERLIALQEWIRDQQLEILNMNTVPPK